MTSFRTSGRLCAAIVLLAAGLPSMGSAQTLPIDDPVLREMWTIGMEQSRTEEFAHHLIDYFGPRLVGSENIEAAQDWLVEMYDSLAVPVRKEPYATWPRWRPGTLHVDMIAPRITSLEAHLMAWSPGTDGPVEADVVLVPEGLSKADAAAWLTAARGKFVLVSAPELMCRAPQELERNARPETIERIAASRDAESDAWEERMRPIGSFRTREAKLDSAGVGGLISSRWSGGWGVNKVFSTRAKQAVAIDLSCEDYGLLYRLLSNGSPPRLRIDAQAEFLGPAPLLNVIAELRGTEKPDEYVLLGAHLDSWGAATGATDNGTGTVTMLEAMRILRATYPNPKRTILVVHWGAEETATSGSASFAEDHPEVVSGLQVAFNQDNGTWRFEKIEGQGLIGAAPSLARWVAALPSEITDRMALEVPGAQDNRGSDHIAFLCEGAPSFRLQSPYDEYRQYTWHTNRDTYDKIVFDDLKENATTAAMLAYLASEDPERVDRTRGLLPIDPQSGKPRAWVRCWGSGRTR